MNILEEVVSTARAAWDVIMKIYTDPSQDFELDKKDDNSPLTKADLAAHHTIVAWLESLELWYPIMSEEWEVYPMSCVCSCTREDVCSRCRWSMDASQGLREDATSGGKEKSMRRTLSHLKSFPSCTRGRILCSRSPRQGMEHLICRCWKLTQVLYDSRRESWCLSTFYPYYGARYGCGSLCIEASMRWDSSRRLISAHLQ